MTPLPLYQTFLDGVPFGEPVQGRFKALVFAMSEALRQYKSYELKEIHD